MILAHISKPEDWRQFLKNEGHWKTGHSAKALAYCWYEADNFPECISSVISQVPEFKNIEPLIAIPEHKVKLTPENGHPSQTDIWVLARVGSDLISIAVEGKVSENFGETIQKWRENESDGKKERLQFLCKELELNYPPQDDLYYQLFHRTASSIIEAKHLRAKYAITLIHSFSQEDEHFFEYKKFVSLFKTENEITIGKMTPAGNVSGIDLYFAWVQGDKDYLKK